MELSVFFAVLFAASIQASWNFFTKKSVGDKTTVLAVGWFMLGCALSLLLPWSVNFAEANLNWFKFGFASGVIHAFYILLLGLAYTVGEISIVYPVARGLGILWTTLFSVFISLNSFTFNGALGILATITGVLLIGLKAISSQHQRKAFLIALAVSFAISFYSIVDSQGAKEVPLVLYIVMMNLFTSILVLPYLWVRSKEKVLAVIRYHKIEALLIAIGGSLSYAIILWAFRLSPVSYVAALREFSVVIAAILGLVFLREELSKRKLIGVVLVTIGAIFLKWS